MQLRFKVAGMTDMGLVRTNNEDNFILSRDLSVDPMRWINNEACLLTPAGALLVVADGMGGMNAGEVASQIAIDTVKEMFSAPVIASRQFPNDQSVNEYLSQVVTEADRRIKVTAQSHPETRGMGTTIVIAWLRDDKLYVTWCGDSRAYVYNRLTGLRRLTKDHSYVQTLVDAGKLTEEQAFDYPQSNIITRCLSDSDAVAEPECLPRPYKVADGDIILLCTDGLCGMMRDRQTQEILQNTPSDDLTVVCRSLIDGALRAGGADNVTVDLLQVVSGAGKPTTAPLPLQAAAAAVAAAAATPGNLPEGIPPVPGSAKKGAGSKPDGLNKLYILGAALAGVVITVALFLIFGNKEKEEDVTAEKTEQTSQNKVDEWLAGSTQPSENGQASAASNASQDVPDQANGAMANALSNVSNKLDKPAQGKQDKPDQGKQDQAGQGKQDKPGQGKQEQAGQGKQDKPGQGKQEQAGQSKQDQAGQGKQEAGKDDKEEGDKAAQDDKKPAARTVVQVTVNKSLATILKEHKMTKKDFEKLNPGLKDTDVKRGQKINVYSNQ